MVACASMLFNAALVPFLTPHNSFQQWCMVFAIYGACLCIANMTFVWLARAEPADWTKASIWNKTAKDGRSVKGFKVTISTRLSKVSDFSSQIQ